MSNVMTATAPKEVKPNEKATHNIVGWILHNVVWIWLVALVLGFGLFNEFFLTVMNMQNIMVQATVLGMLGLAVALPLLVAEIDLSIPANLGFSSAIGALAYSISECLGFPPCLLASRLQHSPVSSMAFVSPSCEWSRSSRRYQ